MSANRTFSLPRLPEKWTEGFPLGNGRIGVMVWGNGESPRFSLDHHEAWDLRTNPEAPKYEDFTYRKLLALYDKGDFETIRNSMKEAARKNPLGPTKVHLGRLDLEATVGSCSETSLSLSTATVSATFAERKLTAFVQKDQDVFCLRLDPWPKDARWVYRPFYETSPGLKPLGHPEVEFLARDGLTVAVQRVLPDKFFAIAWNAEGPEVLVAIAMENSRDEAAEAAVRSQRAATYKKRLAARAAAWKDFWAKSDIALPETSFEYLWRFGLYLLASSAARGAVPPGLQGQWPMDGRIPPWRGAYVTDLNVEQYFAPAVVVGHLDLLDCWLDYHRKLLPKIMAMTRTIFETDGAFHFSGCLPDYTPLWGGHWTPVNFAWSSVGWLTMLAWERWRYSMDKTWLESVGYPLTAATFDFYAANLRRGDDGKLHVPLSDSPEYEEGDDGAWCRDPNIDLAIIRKCCDWIADMETALGTSRRAEKAREIRKDLVDYHLAPIHTNVAYVRDCAPKGKALALWKDKPIDQPHRHPSHLMAIYPGLDLTIEGSDADRAVIDAGVYQYLSLGQYCWAGHTYAEMASFMATIRQKDLAYAFLAAFRDRWLAPTCLHFNRERGKYGDSHFTLERYDRPDENGRFTYDKHGQFTVNESCAFSRAVCDMLLQSWGGRIRLFPATPDHWRDAAFRDWMAEGAFKVSAVRRDGETVWARIEATVTGTCRLQYDFGDKNFGITGPVAPRRNGDDLCWELRAGDVVTLAAPNRENLNWDRAAREIRSQKTRGPVL